MHRSSSKYLIPELFFLISLLISVYHKWTFPQTYWHSYFRFCFALKPFLLGLFLQLIMYMCKTVLRSCFKSSSGTHKVHINGTWIHLQLNLCLHAEHAYIHFHTSSYVWCTILAVDSDIYAIAKIRPEKNQACTGFEPLTSAILVQRSTSYIIIVSDLSSRVYYEST